MNYGRNKTKLTNADVYEFIRSAADSEQKLQYRFELIKLSTPQPINK